MDYLLLACFAFSFLVTYLVTPIWIKAALRIKITGEDMNKYTKPVVAEMGGLGVNAGFLTGVFVYIALSTFYFNQSIHLIEILAVIATTLILMVVGMLDDILGWKIGLKQWQKPVLTAIAAVPIVAVNAGHSFMVIPIVGGIDIGILYPLVIVPVGIMGAANGFNLLAGYNGLEASMGVLILGTLGVLSLYSGNSWLAILAFCMVFALLAFLFFNWYPAKIFPGDAFTYSVGALIACIAIFGNLEKVALILFIPYFIDFLLPLRRRMQVEAFAKPRVDGSLSKPYDKHYDVAHVAISAISKVKGKVYERDVVIFILLIELILILFVLLWVF